MKRLSLLLLLVGSASAQTIYPGFKFGNSGIADVSNLTPAKNALFDSAGRLTGPMSPSALYSGVVTGATIASAGAYAPGDLPVTLTVAGNALGQTAQIVPTGYTVTSATVASAGNSCPAASVYTIASTGTKIIVSDGNGLSGAVVTVSVGGSLTDPSAVPANPVTPTTVTSGCTPPTFNLGWGLAGVSVGLGGWGYTAAPAVTASTSSLSGGSAASVTAAISTIAVNLANVLAPSTDLSNEGATRAAADTANATAIAAETSRAQAAESTLTTSVAANATAIATEKSRAIAAEALLAPLNSPQFTGGVTVAGAATVNGTLTATNGMTLTGVLTSNTNINVNTGSAVNFLDANKATQTGLYQATNGYLTTLNGSGIYTQSVIASEGIITTGLTATGFIYCSSAEGLTSTGSTLSGALKLTAQINVITTVAPGTGVSLPSVDSAGVEIQVMNRGSNALNVYPATSNDIIESNSAGAAQSLAANASATFIKTSASQWRMK